MTAGGLFLVTIESFAEAAVVITLVVAGAGATGAVGGRLVAYGIAAVLGVALLNRRFRLLRRLAGVRREVVRTILGYGFALALVDAAWALFVQMDVILIAAILDSTAAGQFQAPVRLLGLVAYPGVRARHCARPTRQPGRPTRRSYAGSEARFGCCSRFRCSPESRR